jgi:hypothetical protein
MLDPIALDEKHIMQGRTPAKKENAAILGDFFFQITIAS